MKNQEITLNDRIALAKHELSNIKFTIGCKLLACKILLTSKSIVDRHHAKLELGLRK